MRQNRKQPISQMSFCSAPIAVVREEATAATKTVISGAEQGKSPLTVWCSPARGLAKSPYNDNQPR